MKRWLKYVKPYLPYFILGPLCMVIEVIGEVLMPKYLAMIINFGSAYQGLKGFSMPIYTDGWSSLSLSDVAQSLTQPAVWYMIGICGMIVLTALLMMAGGVGGAYFGAKAAVYFASHKAFRSGSCFINCLPMILQIFPWSIISWIFSKVAH